MAATALRRGQQQQPFRQFLDTRVQRWHWPLMLLAAMVFVLLAQSLPVDLPLLARLRGLSRPLSPFEEQLASCRTRKTDRIPRVDTSASLWVLDTYTPQQRAQAERYSAAVGECTSFACLQQANQLPRAPGQHHYPSFFVLGFPKCATTSIYCHLIQHPQVQYPQQKESHVLTERCGLSALNCSAETQQSYVMDMLNMKQAAQANFTKATFEGSTHYVLEGDWLAEQLAGTFPWLKVVISMREPISQAIAMHLHNLAHGRTANCSDEADAGDTSIYHCIRKALKNRSYYPPKLAKWMDFFPRQQLHVLQFENITRREAMGGVMQELKGFLGLDPHLPSNELPLTNYKHQRASHNTPGRSWAMKRWQYEHLVEIAKAQSFEVVGLLGKRGYADATVKVEWMKAWHAVWRENLKRCEGVGRAAPCKITVS